MRLRRATAGDAAQVADVLIASRLAFLPFAPSAHTDDETRAWVRDTLLATERVTVAEDDGAIVGVAATVAHEGITWITQMFVKPGHTGRGMGARLLDHALDFAAHPVRLYTFQQNHGARRFYERHGFVAIELTDGSSNEERCPDVLYELTAPARHPVLLHDYSPEWPELFAAEAKRIEMAFAPQAVAIEHVGSTSVPGMAAKPIVDILLGAPSLAAIEACIAALAALGYRYVPEFEAQLPRRRYFVKPDRRDACFHLHAVEQGDVFWREQVTFRDILRSDHAVFADYLALKRRLGDRFAADREGYTEAKAPFIRGILDRAFHIAEKSDLTVR